MRLNQSRTDVQTDIVKRDLLGWIESFCGEDGVLGWRNVGRSCLSFIFVRDAEVYSKVCPYQGCNFVSSRYDFAHLEKYTRKRCSCESSQCVNLCNRSERDGRGRRSLGCQERAGASRDDGSADQQTREVAKLIVNLPMCISTWLNILPFPAQLTAAMDRDQLLTSDDTVSSSSSPAIFSDEVQRASSPPSSPPGFPWEKQNISSNTSNRIRKPEKSAFSVLGKRKALETISDNARSAKKTATQPTAGANKPLTQMQISLGQETQKKCKTCGMEYVPSSAEDTKLHEKYHKQNTEGYDVGQDFVQKARQYSVFKGAKAGDRVCSVDCHDKPARKRRAQAVLEVVQRELGAVEIPEKQIWDRREADPSINGDPEFRAYMYIRASRCIGLLLVQKIQEAYRVEEPVLSSNHWARRESSEDTAARGALAVLKARQQAEAEKLQQQEKLPIQLTKETYPARLGIARIWTSPTTRRQNIAATLLETALEHHNQHADPDKIGKMKAQKESEARGISPELRAQIDALLPVVERIESKGLVAFSQPTEAGRRLAKRWFGKSFGWGVYVD